VGNGAAGGRQAAGRHGAEERCDRPSYSGAKNVLILGGAVIAGNGFEHAQSWLPFAKALSLGLAMCGEGRARQRPPQGGPW